MCNRPEGDVRKQVETCSHDGVIDYIAKLCKLFFFGFPNLSKHGEAFFIIPSTYIKPFYATCKINYAGHTSSAPSRVYVMR